MVATPGDEGATVGAQANGDPQMDQQGRNTEIRASSSPAPSQYDSVILLFTEVAGKEAALP